MLSTEKTTTLHIKNMVCQRCIDVVGEILQGLGIHIDEIKLGEVVAHHVPQNVDETQISQALEARGFELLENKESQLITQIKAAVLDLVRSGASQVQVTNSEYIAKKVGVNYSSLSKLFSIHEKITIEKYIILQKIESAKELLSYGELSLSEIAFRLGYSNVHHLSNQFKSVTGMSVTTYKQLEDKGRKPLDEI